MKKYRNISIAIAVMIGFSISTLAQGKDDNSKISLTTYISPQTEEITNASTTILINKLNQVADANGLGGGQNSRFIITANVSVLSKDVVPTAPPSIAYTFDVTLYIGDGIEGNKFASHTMTLKGVGQNENKSMIEAFKSIKSNDPALQKFVTTGKNKIVDYYNSKCGQIMKEVKLLEAQNRFEEAIYKLTAIPDASPECYNKALAAIGPIYKKYVDRDCKIKLQSANAIWNANQSIEAANEVGQIITQIDPQSACYSEVKVFSNKVAKRVLELDKREWNYKVDSEIGLQRDAIKAYRDVGVAYGKGQPNSVVYNVNGWW